MAKIVFLLLFLACPAIALYFSIQAFRRRRHLAGTLLLAAVPWLVALVVWGLRKA